MLSASDFDVGIEQTCQQTMLGESMHDLYPRDFPELSQNRVVVEIIDAGTAFEQAKQGRPRSAIEGLLRTSILRVMLVFAEEGAKLVSGRTWSATQLDKQTREFLRRLTIRFHYEKGYDHDGHRLSMWISDWNRSVLAEVEREFEKTPEWQQYLRILRNAAVTLLPSPQSPQSSCRLGYREEVRRWMGRSNIQTVAAAARKLGVSATTLKSIMSSRGKVRYAEETLQRVLEVICEQAA